MTWDVFRRRAYLVGLGAAVVVIAYGDRLFAAEMWHSDLCSWEPANFYWAWIQGWFCS